MMKTISLCLLLSTPVFAGSLDTPVVGGTPVSAGAFPDVALVVAPMALCTGTLVAPDVVLTAGHCIGINPTEVVIGSVDYAKPGGEAIAVKSATAYPNWQNEYDVGVLVLAHASKAKPRTVASACTATEHLDHGAKVKLVGFGLTTKTGTGDNSRLNTAELTVDDATCASDPACAPAVAPGGEFTAGGNGTDSCFGDSGGPLYIDTDHGAVQIGVVSRGVGTTGEPCGGGGVYIRADKVVSWIEKTTGRTVGRARCDNAADGPGDGSDGSAESSGGGCSTGGGALGASFAAIIAALCLARRRA